MQPVKIIGVSHPSQFPVRFACDCCAETCLTNAFSLPEYRPDIGDLLCVEVQAEVRKFQVIGAPRGKKLVIEAVERVKVIYASDDQCESIHTVYFSQPFCLSVLLGHHCDDEIENIAAVIEYISVHKTSKRGLIVSALVFACPEFKQGGCCCPCHESMEPPQTICQYDDCKWQRGGAPGAAEENG